MTTLDVLSWITKMNAEQRFRPLKPIGIDTLMLVLRVSADDLMPLIEELELNNIIIVHPSISISSKKVVKKYGMVSLVRLGL